MMKIQEVSWDPDLSVASNILYSDGLRLAAWERYEAKREGRFVADQLGRDLSARTKPRLGVLSMSFFQVLTIAAMAYLGKAGSFKVGSKTVTVQAVDGAPNHLSLEQALLAVLAVEGGQTGTIQIGDVQVSVQ